MVLTPTQSFPVRTVDISAGGMGIIAAANAPQGAKFTIKILLPTRAGGKQVIEVRAQVQHSIFAADEQGYKVGLIFVDPDRATTSAILEFVG